MTNGIDHHATGDASGGDVAISATLSLTVGHTRYALGVVTAVAAVTAGTDDRLVTMVS